MGSLDKSVRTEPIVGDEGQLEIRGFSVTCKITIAGSESVVPTRCHSYEKT